MKPFIHAKNSVRRFGGVVEDYLEIHNFFDLSKSTLGDGRHRAILHNTLGCFIAERLFGYPERAINQAAEKFGWTEEEIIAVKNLMDLARTNATTSIVNADGKIIQIRDVAEQHCLEDLGCVPTVGDCLLTLPPKGWLRKELFTVLKD